MDAHPHRLTRFRAAAHLLSTSRERLGKGVRRARSIVTLCLAVMMFSGCAGPRANQGAVDVPARKSPAPGIVSPGDTLRLAFRKLPELNQTQRVRADGRVS